jgi:hypothetical protein
MKLYHYDPVTGDFLGETDADPNPLEKGKYLVPAHATKRKAPKAIDGKKRVFGGGKWRQEPVAPAVVPTVATPPEDPVGAARGRRNALLRASDWRVLPDVLQTTPADGVLRIMQYRKALRDVPAQPGFPDNIAWPELAE